MQNLHPNIDTSLKFEINNLLKQVVYKVDGFIDKNNDTLFKDLLYAMNASSKPHFQAMFPESAKDGNLKRPDTLGTQFKVCFQKKKEIR